MGAIDDRGAKSGLFLSFRRGWRIHSRKPVSAPHGRGPRVCWSRGHVKPVLEVSWFNFPAVLMTRLNVTFPFRQILKIDMIKSTTAIDSAEDSHSRHIGVFTEDWKKKHAWYLFLFLTNWHDRVEKTTHKPFHIFLKYCASRMVLEIND